MTENLHSVARAHHVDVAAVPEQRPQRAERRRALAAGQLAVERAQDVDHRAVRPAALLEVEALADQHPRAVAAGVGRCLADEARLADAGLAADQCHGTLAGGGAPERLDQPVELCGPADERRRSYVCPHPPIIAPRRHGRYRALVVWLFAVVAAVLVFAIAAVAVGREAFRLGHQPPATILDLDEAVAQVADDLPLVAQARLSYDDVRTLITAALDHFQWSGVLAGPGRDVTLPGGDTPEVVLADDEAVAVVLGRAEAVGLDVSDDEVYAVIAALHTYLADIGAVGPPASG